VNTFYVSNVERYLFEQGDHGKQFYVNASTLPTDASSTFVRAVTSDISRRMNIPIPDQPTKWRTFLYGMQESLKGVTGAKSKPTRSCLRLAVDRNISETSRSETIN
jgi:hypothetical protein